MASVKWYFDLATGDVSTDKKPGWRNRLGPYDSQEEAIKALEIARRRTEEADAEDAADNEWGENASTGR